MSLIVAPMTSSSSPAAGTPFTGIDNGQFLEYGFFTITPSNVGNGGYITGGDPLSFAGVTDFLKSSYAPLGAQMWSQNPGGSGHSGFQYYYRPGGVGLLATLANGKMQVLEPGNASSPMVEIPNGAYPAGVLTDVIVCQAAFVRV